jgi:subtilisin family serine protease
MTAFIVVMALSLAAGASAGDRYLVVYKKNVPSDIGSQVAGAGGTLVRVLPEIGIAVAVSSDPGFQSAMAGAKNVTDVGPADYNLLPETGELGVENGTGPTEDDYYYEAYQWDIRRVMAPQAWAAGATGSHGTVVAILDTGIAINHPDLTPNVVHMACFDSTGLPCNPYPDVHWHGTHVAGTVAAVFGWPGAVGVGPNLGLAGYKIFEWYQDPDTGLWRYITWSDVRWAAMIDAANQGFKVINMSLGGLGRFGGGNSSGLAALRAAEERVANYMKKMNVTVVASAGNNGVNLNGPVIHLPGDVSGYINVGATAIRPAPIFPFDGSYDIRADYSNYGAALTLSAPGGDFPDDTPYWPGYFGVFSTYVYADSGCAEFWSCGLGYAWATGTSMAAPHVAGVAGLIIDGNPNLKANKVKTILKTTAESLGDRQQFGHGMVDAHAAVTK